MGKVAHATATFSGKLRVAEIGSLTGEIIYDSFENVKVETMADADSLDVISICDLFKNLPASRDKRIAVRGADGSLVVARDRSIPINIAGLSH